MRKIIFNKLKLLSLNVPAAMIAVILCFNVPLACAQKDAQYKTYDPQTGTVINRFSTSIHEIPSGGYKVFWVLQEGGFEVQEEYILGSNYETLWWKVVDDQKNTNYIGEKRGNELFISGQFLGTPIEKKIKIDQKTFYYNPKFGLIDFVRSQKESEHFWGFRQDELKVYPMKATNKGVEVVSVGGEDVEVIKVHWTVNDFRSAFFKRTYWFRKSDGMYVKQKVGGGKFRELVREENKG